jgi:purine-binding chemotaxis protein CheW
MESDTAAEDLELLVFELAGHRYALELRSVREVVPAVLITPLPDAPTVIEGIIDVRGDLVPVYDLRARFGLSPRMLDPSERIVLAWTGSRPVAFRCDRTEWLEHVASNVLEPAAAIRGAGAYITGAARLDDGLVLIHDLETFLDEAEAERLDAALSAQASAGDA